MQGVQQLMLIGFLIGIISAEIEFITVRLPFKGEVLFSSLSFL